MAKTPNRTSPASRAAAAAAKPAAAPKTTNEPSLADRLADVRSRIARAAEKSGREAKDVLLVAVTKYAAPDVIRELIKLGVGDLGENRVQQLAQRAAQLGEFHGRAVAGGDLSLPQRLRWHMVGHLQRNKVKQLLPHVSMIHSVDSLRLAEEIESQLEKTGKKLPVLLQINASEESQKGGVAVGAAIHLADQLATMEHLQIAGVMTMAALDADEKATRLTFSRTREIFDDIRKQQIGGPGFKYLSMGMSNDYEWAIEEGANVVRVGTALFGGKPDDLVETED